MSKYGKYEASLEKKIPIMNKRLIIVGSKTQYRIIMVSDSRLTV